MPELAAQLQCGVAWARHTLPRKDGAPRRVSSNATHHQVPPPAPNTNISAVPTLLPIVLLTVMGQPCVPLPPNRPQEAPGLLLVAKWLDHLTALWQQTSEHLQGGSTQMLLSMELDLNAGQQAPVRWPLLSDNLSDMEGHPRLL